MKFNFKCIRSPRMITIGILLACFSLSACSAGSVPAAARQQPAVNVKVVKASILSFSMNVEYPSQLKAVQEIGISPEISGKVTAVNADVGTSVEAGQVLFSLDDKDVQTQLKQQQASRDYYRVTLEKTQDSTVNQQILTAEQTLSKLETEYNTARNNYENYKILYESGGVSQQDLTEYENKYKSTLIDFNSARENLRILKEKAGPQSVEAARAQLNQADSAVESASQKLDNTAVRSPISGEVAVRSISSGELVSTSTKAFTIIDTTSLIAEVSVPFKMTQNVKVGQMISVKLETDKNKSIEGVVDSISPAPDATSQLYKVSIKIDNENRKIKAGLLARVQLPAEKRDKVLTVPNQAVKIENGLRYIYCVENGAVKKKNVTVGLSDEKVTEIISNLKEGDLVITEGQIFLNDGQKVNISNQDGQEVDKNNSTSGQKPDGSNNAGTQGQGKRPAK